MKGNIVKDKTPNYTAAQEDRIREVAASGPDGKLNLELARSLAAEFGRDPTNGHRSVIAKANRMGVPYARKVAVTKSGGKIEKKEAIVSEIATLLDLNAAALDGAEKAPKGALQAIRDAVKAAA